MESVHAIAMKMIIEFRYFRKEPDPEPEPEPEPSGEDEVIVRFRVGNSITPEGRFRCGALEREFARARAYDCCFPHKSLLRSQRADCRLLGNGLLNAARDVGGGTSLWSLSLSFVSRSSQEFFMIAGGSIRLGGDA